MPQPADLDGFVISIVDSVVELLTDHRYEDDRGERGAGHVLKLYPNFSQPTHSLTHSLTER